MTLYGMVPGISFLHAPDGFFSGPVITLGWLLTAVFVAISLRVTGRRLDERLVPAMGVIAAFIFAAQMLNFPVAGGTSGHMIGAALAAIVLGPWAAIVVMTAVVALQALLFQDGGIAALGLNVTNMGIVPAFAGSAVFILFRRWASNPTRLVAIGVAAGWVSVMLAALATALQLVVSGVSPFTVAVPAMLGVHALIGVGEGLITGAALVVISNARRDLLKLNPAYLEGTAS